MSRNFVPRFPDERGRSLSVLVSVAMIALVLVMGLVVDGGAQAAGLRCAELAASEAARAAVDAGAAMRAAGRPMLGGEATMAAREVLASRGMVGTVEVRGGVVRVTTVTRVPTLFLSVIGIEELTARGDAEASLAAP